MLSRRQLSPARLQDMNEELEAQDKQLEGLQDHAGRTLNDLQEVEATTRRDFKLREDQGAPCSP